MQIGRANKKSTNRKSSPKQTGPPLPPHRRRRAGDTRAPSARKNERYLINYTSAANKLLRRIDHSTLAPTPQLFENNKLPLHKNKANFALTRTPEHLLVLVPSRLMGLSLPFGFLILLFVLPSFSRVRLFSSSYSSISIFFFLLLL